MGEAQDTVVLTCAQPAYGFTAATTYSVQVSLEETFVDETEEAGSNYKVLSTTYTSPTVLLKPAELNAAIVELWKQANPDVENYIGTVIPVYIRLTAVITGSELGNSVSNVIKINQIKLGEVVSTLAPPEKCIL